MQLQSVVAFQKAVHYFGFPCLDAVEKRLSKLVGKPKQGYVAIVQIHATASENKVSVKMQRIVLGQGRFLPVHSLYFPKVFRVQTVFYQYHFQKYRIVKMDTR